MKAWGSELPWHLRVIRKLLRKRYRGSYWLYRFAQRRGWFNRVVRYNAGNGIAITVPLFRESNLWDYLRHDFYEQMFLDQVAKELASLKKPVRLIDCGADIGLFSALLVARGTCLEHVIAFEPNTEAYPFLEENLNRLGVAAQALNCAVSDFTGLGELCIPDYEELEHSLYLKPNPAGKIQVKRIDDLNLDMPGGLLLKIDVEGAELHVLHGARKTLSQARACVITLEAHRDVVRRTGIDPTECLRFLNSIGSFHVYISEEPATRVHMDRPFFEQAPNLVVCNLICVRGEK